ncbi:alcohol oxidase [Sistotremastrum niveocremeum HHB9708]|uniref:Alcohol oxidase n=2 Tax=Sistotremastraceae TaxID=3402574 RepID=A0A165A7B9_9AGAM|nr:alcohol oxidase [Sistotremastrum niveocremeum HHB9708]KZT43493.1 alcohol oxidase [Sistotremastrum suecicum HHB10207 ss-3]
MSPSRSRLLSAALLLPFASALSIVTDPSTVASKSFTHVIVGGGTAGLTVASRLSEVSKNKILVIEAGPNERGNPTIDDPAQETNSVGEFGWFYNTVPQQVGGLVQTIYQGEVLGGSSAINGMQWTRGTKDQYDAFQALGSPGWNFSSLLTYMKKSEIYHVPNAEQRARGATSVPSVHGTQGQVNVGFPQPWGAWVSYQSHISSVLATFPDAQRNPDIGTGTPNGASVFVYSIKPGTSETPGGNVRSSSAAAYIYPFLGTSAKPNLTILVGHQATTIVWDRAAGKPGKPKAIGVKFAATPAANTTIGTVYSVVVQDEVIVSSGALGSPRFLELSGIGDKNILKKAGVPVMVDLPSVGTNLQDQPLTTSLYQIKPGQNSSVIETANQITEGSVAYIELNQILGAKGPAAGQYLLNSISDRAQAIVKTGGFTSVSGLKKVLQYQANSIVNEKAPVVEYSFAVNLINGTFAHLVWNLLPQVRGTIHITSSNPAIYPALDPKYLTTQFELDLHGNATKLSRTIFGKQPLASLWNGEIFPGQNLSTTATDAQWQKFIAATYTPVLHPVGTVALLPQEDGGAVDPNLIVYGTQNVRVVDSSIIPIQISAHLSATVYGIAERAADIIKGVIPPVQCD